MTDHEKLVAIAESVNELRALEAERDKTQAKMIRSCVAAIQRRGRGHYDLQAARDEERQIRKDRANAFIYLEWLATALETGKLPPDPVLVEDGR